MVEYRKKSVEAFFWDGKNTDELMAWVRGFGDLITHFPASKMVKENVRIGGADRTIWAVRNEWVVRDKHGSYDHCPDETYREAYELNQSGDLYCDDKTLDKVEKAIRKTGVPVSRALDIMQRILDSGIVFREKRKE
jgi:hypothetical protein